jgi:hypothetical protein
MARNEQRRNSSGLPDMETRPRLLREQGSMTHRNRIRFAGCGTVCQPATNQHTNTQQETQTT